MIRDLPIKLGPEFPFAPNSFESKDGTLHYVDEGEGPVVVMVHGNPTWSFLYRDIIQELSPYYRCIAMDHLGCGLSEKPDDTSLYTLDQHIERTVKLIESLEIKSFVLLVHDWGGPIGLGAAARLKDKVKGICITNTAAFPFKRIPKRISVCRIPFFGDFIVRGLNGFVRAAKTMTTVKPLREIEQYGYSFPYDSWENRVAINAFVKDIPMRKGHASYPVIQSIEKSLSHWDETPVALFWGMQDWCFHPVLIPEFKQRIPHAEVFQYETAGHYLFEDNLKRIATDLKAKLSQFFS